MANPVTWFEITGKDGKKLQNFYSGVFGWKVDANNPMNYGMVDNAGEGIGGGISGGDGSPNQVTFYIAGDDPQALLNKGETQGGKTGLPRTPDPDRVHLPTLADPEGQHLGT